MKKKSIFNYEINESVQAHAAMNCLRNRNTHKSLIKENCGSKNRVQEQEENSRIEKMSPTEKFDERFKYSSRIRKMANDITKKAYMIIRNEYGDGMWRALHMDDCDEFGLVSQINDYQKYYGITNPQDIVDCLLGKKSVKNFKKSHEEQEENVDYAQLADDVCASYRGPLSKLDLKGRINYIVKMVAKQIGKTVDTLTPQELTAIQKAAKHSVWYVSE